MNRKKDWIEPGGRVMDIAYLRDGELFHTGEALVLALLLHTTGGSRNNREAVEQVARMLNDPNISRKPRPTRR